jgi:acyl-CoA synthetase (AMP-forming)/AMP-acid ligase II
VTAVVQLRYGVADAPDVDDLAAHVRRTLAGYKAPRDLVVVEQVRRSPTGKPDYRWAKQIASNGE